MRKRLTSEIKNELLEHIELELRSSYDNNVKSHLLLTWVVSLVECADEYPDWFEPPLTGLDPAHKG